MNVLSSRVAIFGCLILFGVTLAVYLPAFSLGFVEFDDNIYAYQNPNVEQGLTWDSVRYAFTTFDSGNWIPVTWLSLMLDASLFGVRPGPMHATNVLIDAVNCCLLFVWLWRLTGAVGRSFAVAVLFAVHPLHVESVAWVAERKDVVSMFFFLSMLLAYDWYRRRPSPGRYLLVVSAFGFGLMSKSMLVTAPVLLILLDFWPGLRRQRIDTAEEAKYASVSPWMMIGEKIPLLVMSAVIGVITIQAQQTGPTTAFISPSLLPFEYRIGNAIAAYGWYLLKTLAPIGLGVMYAHPLRNLAWGNVAVSGLCLLAITIFVIRAGLRDSCVWLGWSWFVITLLPVIGLLQVGTQAYADRYCYIPQIGLLIAIVWTVQPWLRSHRVGILTLVVIAVAFGSLTFQQIGYWKDTVTMWNRALQVDPNNWAAHRQVGFRELGDNHLDQAYDHLSQAARINSRFPDVFNALGNVHRLREEWKEAEQAYQRALSLSPGYADSMHNLFDVLKKQRRSTDAIPFLTRYLERRSQDVKMRIQLGLIHARRGALQDAYQQFSAAYDTAPDDIAVRSNLGLTLMQLGRNSEARPHLEAAVAAQPDDPNWRVNLGILLQSLNLPKEAKTQFEAALRLAPNDQEAKVRLNQVSAAMP